MFSILFFMRTWKMPLCVCAPACACACACACVCVCVCVFYFILHADLEDALVCVCVCVFFLLFLTDNLHSCLRKNGNTFYQLFNWCIPQ